MLVLDRLLDFFHPGVFQPVGLGEQFHNVFVHILLVGIISPVPETKFWGALRDITGWRRVYLFLGTLS